MNEATTVTKAATGWAVRYTDELGCSYLAPRYYRTRAEGVEAVHYAAVTYVAGRKVEPSRRAVVAAVKLVPVVSEQGVLSEATA